MSYQCPLLIEFTPRGGDATTLVAADGWLAELPQLSAEQQLLETDGGMLAEAFFRALGGATVSFTLAIEHDESTLLAAQNAFLSSALPTSGALSCIATEWRVDFSKSVMADVTPNLPSGTGAATLHRFYQITCGLPTYSLIP